MDTNSVKVGPWFEQIISIWQKGGCGNMFFMHERTELELTFVLCLIILSSSIVRGYRFAPPSQRGEPIPLRPKLCV